MLCAGEGGQHGWLEPMARTMGQRNKHLSTPQHRLANIFVDKDGALSTKELQSKRVASANSILLRHIWQAGLPAQQRVLRSDIAIQWSRRSLTSLVGSDAANIGFWGQPQRLARRRQYPWFSQRHQSGRSFSRLSRWHMPSRPGRRRL
jgi:hypothetical protein